MPPRFEHEYPGKAGLFWVRHEHIGGLGAFVARSAVAKGEHLFVGRMEGPDLGAGRTDLINWHSQGPAALGTVQGTSNRSLIAALAGGELLATPADSAKRLN